MRENRFIVLLVAVIVVCGALLRFWSLGHRPLTSQELEFHFAARSVATGAAPSLPSGVEFGHGAPMIRTINALQGTLRDDESAARLPSAILGTLALVLFAALAWLIGGPWSALIATFLFAFYPEAIRQSRTAGLYSFHELCGVIALGAGWLATAKSGPRQSSTPADLIRRWIWAAVALLALAMAGLAHLSAATVFVGFAVWVLALAIAAIWISGPRAILNNLAVQLVIVGLLGCAALFLVKPDIIGAVRDKISSAPSTPQLNHQSASFYLESFGSQFGWVLTLLPLIILITIRKYTWLTTYLMFWFVVPLVGHSLFISRKEERLLLMAAPALFLLAGLAVSEAREMLARAINVHAREWLPSYRSAVRTANQITVAVLAFAVLTLPALPMSLRVPNYEGRTAPSKADWASMKLVLDESPNSQFVPIGSTEPLTALQYLGHSDFAVGQNLGYLPPSDVAAAQARERFRPAVDSVRIEGQSGAVLASTMANIRDAYLPYGEVFLAVDARSLNGEPIDRGLQMALDSNAVDLCQGRCGTLRLYRLKLLN